MVSNRRGDVNSVDLRTQPQPASSLVDVRRRGRMLFQQQMWCWGRDICRDRHNLLLEYGLQREPSPEKRYHSRYCYQAAYGQITLWGFALWYACPERGSLCLKRQDFLPQWSPLTCVPDIWRPELLPSAHSEPEGSSFDAMHSMLIEVLNFIYRYELWITTQVGIDYRRQVIAAYPERRKGFIAAEAMAGTWADLEAYYMQQFTVLDTTIGNLELA